VFDPDFHEGVVGIVASRIKDKLHRPTFVFAASAAPGKEHELKGSGRSIAGFHLRDALDLVAKRYPGVLLRFGGHAMAAGCTIAEENFDTFEQGLNEVAQEWLDAATLTRRIETDGPLKPEYRRVELVDVLHKEVWGQGFAPPTFSEEVEVVSQRLLGEKHLALKLKHQGQPVDGIWFRPHRAAASTRQTRVSAGCGCVERDAAGEVFGGSGAGLRSCKQAVFCQKPTHSVSRSMRH
jgi:single-stranded-DNA-specific exonuclease